MPPDRPDLRADDLRYLAVLADTGRMTSAARTLGVDQSTVSRRLKVLETSLGARVLRRGADGWHLTEAGRAVLEHARAIQRAVDSVACSAVGKVPEQLSATVRIAAADAFGSLFVVPAVARVRTEHPRLNVELVTGSRALTLREVGFDLAVTIGTPTTRLTTEPLCEYDNAFYGSNRYLTENGDPSSIEDLREHPLIFFVDDMERIHELDLVEYVPGGTVRFTSTNIFAQLEAVRQGMGIAFMSNFVTHTALDVRKVRLRTPPARVPVTLAARPEALDRPEVQVIREALHEEVAARRHELVPPAFG